MERSFHKHSELIGSWQIEKSCFDVVPQNVFLMQNATSDAGYKLLFIVPLKMLFLLCVRSVDVMICWIYIVMVPF